jgi:predicted neuraminidase
MIKLNKFTLIFCLVYTIIAGLILRNTELIKTSQYLSNFLNINNFTADQLMVNQARFESNIIPQPSKLVAAHSATITKLKDGRLLALWFAGSHEGNADVSIWQSYYSDSKWSLATVAVDRRQLAATSHTLITKLGNSVVYQAINGKLYLFVTTVSVGGWSGSRIYQLTSLDNGQTWIKPRSLIISPLLNISSLIRTAAVTLSNGGFYLPIYHEAITSYPELLYFSQAGELVYQQRLSNTSHLMQPSLLVFSKQHGLAYFRNHTNINLPLRYLETTNGGKSWFNLRATNLDNQDSSIATAKLATNWYIMLRNVRQRSQLVISSSIDGITWHDVYNLENSKDSAEFSYPVILVDGDMVEVLYTWQRKYIKHVRFNLAWLREVAHG